MKLRKSDYIFQIAMYNKPFMISKGYNSYKDLEKLTLKELKDLFSARSV